MKTEKQYVHWYKLAILIFVGTRFPYMLSADSYPPDNDSNASGRHYAPVAWPAKSEWKPYTRFGYSTNDPRTQDPSNGGTAPQNYVNIASSCVDKDEPSIYYYLHKGAASDGSEDIIMFRWRVEQIANTYATGSNAGSYSEGDPWNSALWTVLFDIDGDGYRDIAAHLDGSSGSPGVQIDMLRGVYGKIPTQSIDFNDDPDNIKILGHNPTAFVDKTNTNMSSFTTLWLPSFISTSDRQTTIK